MEREDVQKRAARHATAYAAAIAVDTVLWLVALPFITRAIDVETFGQFTLIRVVVPFLLAVVDVGCGVATVRALADTPDPAPRRALVGTLVGSRAVIAAGLAVVGLVVAACVHGPLGLSLGLAGILTGTWTLHGALLDAARGLGRHAVGATMLAVSGAAGFVAILSFVVWWKLGLPGVIGGILVGYVVSVVIGLTALRPHLERPQLAIYRRLLRFGAPAAAYFGLRAGMALDRYVLGAVGGLTQAGLFQLASTPTGGIELMEQAGILAIEPTVYGASEKERPILLAPIFRIGALLVVGAGTFLGLLAPEVVALLAPPEYRAALGGMAMLTFAAVARALARVIGVGAGSAGQTRIWATFQTVEVALAVVLMIITVPRLGIVGAASAHLVASVVAVFVCHVLVGRAAPAFDFALTAALTFLVAGAVTSLVLATDVVRPAASLGVRAGAFAVVAALGAALLYLPPGSRRRQAVP